MEDNEYKKKLVKNMQMLATLVATATYAAAFSPPGGVWQDIHDATGQHLPGDPIMRSTDHGRYLVFFYCNAAAFAVSLAVVVLTLLVPAQHKTGSGHIMKHKFLVILMSLMLFAMLALAAAYGAGACQDKLAVAWYCVLLLVPLAPFIRQIIIIIRLQVSKKEEEAGQDSREEKEDQVSREEKEGQVSREEKDYFRKLMVPVCMFAVTITYMAGLSTPGGFWDTAEAGHRPGDAILKDRQHGRTLRGFLLSNTLAFTASLYGVSIVMLKRTFLARFNIIVVVLGLLVGLLVAYISASSRGRSSTAWLTEAALVGIMLYVAAYVIVMKAIRVINGRKDDGVTTSSTEDIVPADETEKAKKRRRQIKLVQLMASLAVAITYQAGLYPPGGLWSSNTDDHTAGDPILLTTNYTRYRGFHYCNSLSFVASLLAMLLAQKESLHNHHALEAAMLLDMLGLIGAYAIGSCRDQVSTLYVVGIAGAVVVYVFVHVSYFTLGDADNKQEKYDELEVEKMKGRFLLFAILVASMTYQAGLTPPGGFLLMDDAQSGQHAGDPVLRYNYPRRYSAFFYCNSVSFMVSIVIILLLINPIEYRPAIRSHAISVCSVASYVGLMGAFAAGSTQHMKGSIYFFVLAAVVTLFCLLISLWLWLRLKGDKATTATVALVVAATTGAAGTAAAAASITIVATATPPQSQLSASASARSNSSSNMGAVVNPAMPPTSAALPSAEQHNASGGSNSNSNSNIGVGANPATPNIGPGGRGEEEARTTTSEKKSKEGKTSNKSVYLVTLAILVASATYPAGLDPPGGSWQSSSDGHDAGNPMMLDNRRPRYLAFFLSNTTSFMASVILIHMLLPAMLHKTKDFHESYRRKGFKGLVYLQCLGFLVAYAAGSSRRWKTSVYTGSALVILMLIFFFTHIMLSKWRQKKKEEKKKNQTVQHCLRPCNHCTMQSV